MYRLPFAITQLSKGDLILREGNVIKEVERIDFSDDFALIHFTEGEPLLLSLYEKRLLNLPILPMERRSEQEEEAFRHLKTPCKIDRVVNDLQLSLMPYTWCTDAMGRSVVECLNPDKLIFAR